MSCPSWRVALWSIFSRGGAAQIARGRETKKQTDQVRSGSHRRTVRRSGQIPQATQEARKHRKMRSFEDEAGTKATIPKVRSRVLQKARARGPGTEAKVQTRARVRGANTRSHARKVLEEARKPRGNRRSRILVRAHARVLAVLAFEAKCKEPEAMSLWDERPWAVFRARSGLSAAFDQRLVL